MEHDLGVAKKEGVTEEEIGAVLSIFMAVSGGKVCAQFRNMQAKMQKD